MTTINDNEKTFDAIGHIDIDGLLIHRERLSATLPDIARFERCLPEALRINAYMSEHDGAVPSEAMRMQKTELDDIIDTLREIGQLQRQAADNFTTELARRDENKHLH